MDPAILHSADRLMCRHDILGVMVWRGDRLYYQNTAPCFSTAQIEALGREIHSLFAGYQSMGRSMSGLSMLYGDRYICITVLKDGDTTVYLAALAGSLASLELANEKMAGWTVDALFEKEQKTSGSLDKPRGSTRQLWSHYLLRLKARLEGSLDAESGSRLLSRAFAEFGVGPTQPLPDGQWLAFGRYIADQISDQEALRRFNQLHLEGEDPGLDD